MTLPSDRIQPFDMSRALMLGVQMRNARMQQQANQLQYEQQQRAFDRQKMIDEALQSGNMERWQQLDPTGYANYAAKVREGQKAEIEQAKALQGMSNDRAKRTEQEREFVARTLNANPRSADLLRKRVDTLQRQGLIDPIDVPTTTQSLPDGVMGPADQVTTPEQLAQVNASAGYDPLAKVDPNIREYLQSHKADSMDAPGFAERYDAWNRSNKKSSAATQTVNTSLSPQINNSPLTPAGQTKVGEELGTTRANLYSLNKIKALNPEQFLGYWNRFKIGALSELDKVDTSQLSEDDKNYLGQARNFVSTIKQFFNAYRKAVTGTGASVGELRDIESSMINTKLGPTEFNAQLQSLISDYERDVAVKSALLDHGYQLGTEDFMDTFDAVRAAGAGYKEALAEAVGTLPPTKVVEGKGKSAHVVTKPPIISPAALQAAAVQAADRAIQSKQAPPEARQQMIDAYIAEHGGGK